jgi:hypothetical protein
VGGKPRTVRVPVEMTDGLNMESLADNRSKLGVQVYRTASPAPGGAPAVRGLSAGAGGAGGSAGRRSMPAMKRAEMQDSLKAVATESPEQRFARIVEEKLRKAKGEVTIQILLTKWDPKILTALEELGFKIEEKDKALKVLFGTIDAKKLKDLAQLTTVSKITPLE